MSQITRCPACRTSFRVVADQLRISGGWVRCGRCKEVFDASTNLLADVRYAPVRQNKGAEAAAPSASPAPEDRPASAQPPKVLVPPSNFPLSVPVPDEAPSVWSTARASVPGSPDASIQPRALEHPQGQGPKASADAAQTPASAQPWAGHFSSPLVVPTPARAADSFAAFSTYGERRESNVMPPDWVPDVATRQSPGEQARDTTEAQRVEPEVVHQPDTAGDSKIEPTLEPTPGSSPAPGSATIVFGDADTGDEDDDEEMPELTFEASRQHELVDEPLIFGERGEDEVDDDLVDEADALKSDEAGRVEPEIEHTDTEPQNLAPDTTTDVPYVVRQAAEVEVATPSRTSDQAPATAAPTEGEVGFIRDARRKAFWSKPVTRVLLVLLAVGLLIGFAVQYAVTERNRLAAVHPALRPSLELLCLPLRCEVGLPRQIASVAIDSSTFTRVKDDATSFNLQVALKSTADMVLEMPALELTLTDSSDQPVLRRVLKREDTGAPAELAAHGEWNGTVKLQVPEVADRVTGYRLLAFYP